MEKYFEADVIRLVHSGGNYFEVLNQIIEGAQKTLHFQTYIFDNDNTGNKVAESLQRAARRGVQVFLMVDAIGSFPFSSKMQDQLREAGIHFRLFAPLLSAENIFVGRRLHHKIVVADKRVALIGGINIADKYNSVEEDCPWLDYALYSEGKVNEYLHLLCEQFYFRKNRTRVRKWEHSFVSDTDKGEEHLIRYRSNDWIHGRNEVHRSYREAITRSESDITMVASYFLPGASLRQLLKKASSRGVKIRIILAGRSDIHMLRQAEHFLYDYYLRHHIEIYEWRNSVMHGKAMIVDKTWATIGSYNLNFLSKYASIELNADVLDHKFICGFHEHLDEIIKYRCSPIDLKIHTAGNTFPGRIVRWFSFQILRVIMNFFMLGGKYRRSQKK